MADAFVCIACRCTVTCDGAVFSQQRREDRTIRWQQQEDLVVATRLANGFQHLELCVAQVIAQCTSSRCTREPPMRDHVEDCALPRSDAR